jgi:protein NirF
MSIVEMIRGFELSAVIGKLHRLWLVMLALLLLSGCANTALRGTGDMGLIVERAEGRVKIIEHSNNQVLATVSGLGDLSHASVVYSRDARYAFVFGRDGGLTKVDLLNAEIVGRVIQAGNSIGGAISQDGTLVAVSNYKPGGVRIFDTETLDAVANIPAVGADGTQSKVVGLVDAPGNQFVFSLYDADEIWIADLSDRKHPQITKFTDIGRQPYDGLLTPDGRIYIAGLFGEDGLALLDLWHPDQGVRRILQDYGRGQKKMPVYKMPHLEGWAIAGDYALLPAVGRDSVLVVRRTDWQQVASIPVHGQPVFVMARPDGRQVWVNFAFPDNDTVQIIDTEKLAVVRSLKPGKAVLHMEFTPRGEAVWISSRDEDKVLVYDTQTLNLRAELKADKPSGIFFSSRAHEIGL